ncbi:MAG: aminotransferase class I/II-fold pyridoxal phosphate-dependent enzyme [Sphaerochaetaceae bacterium]|jgi:aspartate/methionine/tyrosine aminotransferase|nr:aminotransferase class I/II-fold pyridoxal phosphate-dependent enzyme [Sphaerochaetaceae bacterium]NLO61444.1 aminotransferase class I/II-fold pyridoxal phosphate-dependent enzyme [Spirochaetales bacterium]MDD2405479.1 aminotransferase class I/II-fold pyridoxal phosphate-dependent enzyme [Sphaerochaetaceae bacterium]MDD3670443.1 aminotransferase class I/II-fold pyridoxal phosphate-dependent enzyme [Sphaerochaetaceae bacterium]MDD4258574.1 aminotransferase class I/II-fold pyridoxal phosphate-
MNPLAQELNRILEGTIVDKLLSDYGRRMYFPKGIISQSAEAKQKATKYNATIGIATESGSPMYLPSIYSMFAHDGLTQNEIFPYAPTAGEMQLRKLWYEDMLRKNPTMKDKKVSLPIVTSGLTHSISLVASLFLEKNDTILVPDMYWGNYNLTFVEQREAKMIQFPLFSNEALNIDGLEKAIDSLDSQKINLILNFPNNPSGYSPKISEAQRLCEMLTKKAFEGKHLLVLLDDAYFDLFYEENLYRESLFSMLCDAHEHLFAVKGDAATKEEMVWGFRIGFLTFGAKGLTDSHYEALTKKTMGLIRGSVSSCSKPSQNLLIKAMQSPHRLEEKEMNVKQLAKRYHLLKTALGKYAHNKHLVPLPFNSGYFMAFVCAGDAEALRIHLLDTYKVGTISIQGTYLRLAFSSVDLEDIEDLVTLVYKGADEVFGA